MDNETKLKPEIIETLEKYKAEKFKLLDAIHRDIAPLLMEDLRQIRELTQNIALIAGAIAAFTIQAMTSTIIKIPIVAHISLIILFCTILYAIHHLTEVIPKEINSLYKQHSTYADLLNESIDRVNKVIKTGNILELEVNEENVKDKLESLKEEQKTDKSLNRLKYMLTTALILLLVSFIHIRIPTDKSVWVTLHYSILNYICTGTI